MKKPKASIRGESFTKEEMKEAIAMLDDESKIIYLTLHSIKKGRKTNPPFDFYSYKKRRGYSTAN